MGRLPGGVGGRAAGEPGGEGGYVLGGKGVYVVCEVCENGGGVKGGGGLDGRCSRIQFSLIACDWSIPTLTFEPW